MVPAFQRNASTPTSLRPRSVLLDPTITAPSDETPDAMLQRSRNLMFASGR